MNKRIFIGILAIFFILIFLGSTCSIPGENYFREKKITYIVSKNIVIGCGKGEVIGFLKNNGIENSGYYENEEIFTGRFINAIIRDTSWGFLGNASMEMKFSFDEKGKLIKYDIAKRITSP